MLPCFHPGDDSPWNLEAPLLVQGGSMLLRRCASENWMVFNCFVPREILEDPKFTGPLCGHIAMIRAGIGFVNFIESESAQKAASVRKLQ